jgi:hypothetical protein
VPLRFKNRSTSYNLNARELPERFIGLQTLDVIQTYAAANHRKGISRRSVHFPPPAPLHSIGPYRVHSSSPAGPRILHNLVTTVIMRLTGLRLARTNKTDSRRFHDSRNLLPGPGVHAYCEVGGASAATRVAFGAAQGSNTFSVNARSCRGPITHSDDAGFHFQHEVTNLSIGDIHPMRLAQHAAKLAKKTCILDDVASANFI